MRAKFVPTQNAKEFLARYKALEQRGAEEACLMLAEGDPGTGKTTTVQWWAVQSGAPFVRAKEEYTPAWLLRDLLGELHVTPEYSYEKMFRQAVKALAKYAADAQRDGRPTGVIIDEADHISRNKRMMETVRDLSDMLEIPFILVGMGKVAANLTRFPMIARRVGQTAVFSPMPLSDAQDMVTALCEVEVKPCLVEFMHRAAAGKSSEIKEGIAAIERFGKRNTGAAIGVAEMAGQMLFNDRTTGKPIIVRA